MNIPSVGSVVNVTVRYKNISLFDPSPWTDRKYTGVVVKNAKWVDANSFSLQTNDKEYPVKIINSGYISKIEIVSGNSIGIRRFNVQGKGGNYVVTKSGKNYSCTCIGFKYHSKCKHISAVIKKVE